MVILIPIKVPSIWVAPTAEQSCIKWAGSGRSLLGGLARTAMKSPMFQVFLTLVI